MDNWPDNDHLLAYVKESREHERAWKIIAGLSKRLMQERGADGFVKKVYGPAWQPRPARTSAPLVGPKPESWSDRIQALEAKIVQQKAAFTKLEECRTFERETEQILVQTLEAIRSYAGNDPKYLTLVAQEVLIEYQTRLGPRPIADQGT